MDPRHYGVPVCQVTHELAHVLLLLGWLKEAWGSLEGLFVTTGKTNEVDKRLLSAAEKGNDTDTKVM